MELFTTQEDFYFIVLVTTGEGRGPLLAARSTQELARAAATDPQYAEWTKWSYADSAYCDIGASHFSPIASRLASRPGIDDLDGVDWEIELHTRVQLMEDALAKLDEEGLFSRNQPRERVLVNVELIPPDASNTQRARRLNTPENLALAAWLTEAAEPEG